MRSFGRETVHVEGPSLGYIFATEMAKSIVVLRPFLIWPVMLVTSILLRILFPGNIWVVLFIVTVSALLAVYAWFLTHTRHTLGSFHGAGTILALGAILAFIVITGWHKPSIFLMLMAVPLVCLTWSMRSAIRDHKQYDAAHLAGLFNTAGVPGANIQLHAPEPGIRTPRKIPSFRRTAAVAVPELLAVPEDDTDTVTRHRQPTAKKALDMTVYLQPGDTPDSLRKNARSIESAAGWPPGTMNVNDHLGHAGMAHISLSDPRAISEPMPHPGALFSNGSVADPISVGMYQDGKECEFTVPETQIQIMGQVGSGKSLGAAWSTLAELITRKDAVIWAIDITKGRQTLGPVEGSLHRLATTPAEAISVLRDAQGLIKTRTDYLAAKGLGKWQKDCGIDYLIIWIEEVPEVMEALAASGDDGEDLWIKSVKAARSAGITFAWSLQRADYTQIPTITRGQAIKWCFGVADSHEASFGLSEIQGNSGCAPERWGQRQPGMCYLDAPSIEADQIPVPLRTWYWGPDDKIIKAHAEKFPASARPPRLDGKGIWSSETPGLPTAVTEPEDDEPETPVDQEYDMRDEELDTELEPLDGDFELSHPEPEGERPGPEEARAKLREWLVERAGQSVRNADLSEVRDAMGYSRRWSNKVLSEFESAGLVARDDEASTSQGGIVWTVTADPAILES